MMSEPGNTNKRYRLKDAAIAARIAKPRNQYAVPSWRPNTLIVATMGACAMGTTNEMKSSGTDAQANSILARIGPATCAGESIYLPSVTEKTVYLRDCEDLARIAYFG